MNEQQAPERAQPESKKLPFTDRVPAPVWVVAALAMMGVNYAIVRGIDSLPPATHPAGVESEVSSIAEASPSPAAAPRNTADESDASEADPIDFQVASKRKLEEQLRDPGSAEYDDVRMHLISKGNEKANYTFCGTVNAKNGFGGYTGKQRFVANPLSSFWRRAPPTSIRYGRWVVTRAPKKVRYGSKALKLCI